MQKFEITQSGDNPDYPRKAIIWRYGVDPVPEWLSDRAKIKCIDNNGNPQLEIRNGVSGEIEIIESGGRNVLVKMKTKDSILLYSETHPIISLTPHQLELLY